MRVIQWQMPVLCRHAGEWEGVYTHIDTDNQIVDQHRSHLKCSFPDDGAHDYYQINTYLWDDGRTEEMHFPATYAEGCIWWDTERIEGKAWEIDPRTVCLTWRRKDMPGSYLYEMIQISDDNAKRGRTWHWFQNDELFQRTCIKEARLK